VAKEMSPGASRSGGGTAGSRARSSQHWMSRWCTGAGLGGAPAVVIDATVRRGGGSIVRQGRY
jgi:hypothetical protein